MGVRIQRQRMRAPLRRAASARSSRTTAARVQPGRSTCATPSTRPSGPSSWRRTSVGQEGLDFHPYCHAVVHWNLPSNPVDLEQREGRVHRYKGHAVRKNVARRYGLSEANPSATDPWMALFATAVERPSRAVRHESRSGSSRSRTAPGSSATCPPCRVTRHRPPRAPPPVARRVPDGLRPATPGGAAGLPSEPLPGDQRARLAEDLRIDLSPPGAC